MTAARVFCLLALAYMAAGIPLYLHSSVGDPWDSLSPEEEMTRAFGAEGTGWETMFFETNSISEILDPSRTIIYIEGSDDNAQEAEAWFNTNRAAVENFVSAGGRVFFNVAPNEDNGFDMGFGSHPLAYPDFNDFAGAPADETDHPIYNSPYVVPTGGYEGNWAAHASIGGAGICLMIDEEEPDSCIVLEVDFGRGRAVLGGLTTSNFWEPTTEASLLRTNILSFTSTPVSPIRSELPESIYMYEPFQLELRPTFFPGDTDVYFEIHDAGGDVLYQSELQELENEVTFRGISGMLPEGDTDLVLIGSPSDKSEDVGVVNVCSSHYIDSPPGCAVPR